MHFLCFLLRTTQGMLVLVVVAGLLSGACNAGLLALINTALHHAAAATTTLVWYFAGLSGAKLATSAFSRVLLTRLSQRTIADVRLALSRTILAAPLRHVEDIGIARLLATLTDDVQDIRQALLALPSVALVYHMLTTRLNDLLQAWFRQNSRHLGSTGLKRLWHWIRQRP